MTLHLNRRALLGGIGALSVSVVLPGAKARAAIFGAETSPPLKPELLSSYIRVNADGSVVAFWGKMDMGQGTDLGVAQMVAEELDLPVSRVSVVQGDTATSVNQGGASGSTGIQKGGRALQSAAAEARYQLVEMAARHLELPAADLVVADGVVSARADPARRVSYAELIGGRFFDVQLEWNSKIGNDLFVKGNGTIKPVSEHKVIGTSPARRDVAPKVMGVADYVVDVKVEGMLHARVIRPPVAGAVPLAVNEASIAQIPGARVVRKHHFLAVAAPKEWHAIKAADALAVTWSQPKPPFPPFERLADHIRAAPAEKRDPGTDVGDVDGAFAGAARVVEAEYRWPFQSHASMGPACAVVRIEGDRATVWTGSQKPHATAVGVAAVLDLPPENVRGIWVPGPGSYGRNDAGDAAADAALIASLTGAPVRVQYMRDEGTGWDPKGPASIHRLRAAIDRSGAVAGWHVEAKGFSRMDVGFSESAPKDTLAGHLTGCALEPIAAFGGPEESYRFPAKRKAWETIAPLLDRASPLRCAHLRDPVGPQNHFASESFVDEVARATGKDPVAFRLAHLSDPRDIAVVRAAAEKAGWGRPLRSAAKGTAVGRGIAYAQRSGTHVAVVCEVEVERATAAIRVRRVVVAHDCGMIVNPRQLTLTLEGNVMQGISRTLHEEVRFDTSSVTSVDWESYPILDITDTPDAIDVVLIGDPAIAPSGAGEATIRVVPAAIANAIHDATGTRVREVPLTPARLKAAGLS